MFLKQDLKVVVIGAGVIGLSVAILLKKSGFTHVDIIADRFSPDTTSDVATALWMPYQVTLQPAVLEWCKTSLQHYLALMPQSAAGITWIEHTEISENTLVLPDWYSLTEAITPRRVPGYKNSYTAKLLLIDTSI